MERIEVLPQLSRPAAGLSAILERNLAGYASVATAAGVSAMALAAPAQARIVYTQANIPIVGNVYLDLNHDGIPDFRFSTLHLSGARAGRPQTSFVSSLAQLRVYPTKLGNDIWGHSSYASALKPGVQVGPKFAQGGFSMVQVAGISGRLSAYYGPWQGTQQNRTVKNHYVGFKFKIKGKVHYGWARLDVTVKYPISATLTGYAYETVANKPIVTGRKMGNPTRQATAGSAGGLAPAGSLGALARGSSRPTAAQEGGQ
jgi:hypothetical protein